MRARLDDDVGRIRVCETGVVHKHVGGAANEALVQLGVDEVGLCLGDDGLQKKGLLCGVKWVRWEGGGGVNLGMVVMVVRMMMVVGMR